jgi:hypothetical protein
MPIIEECCGAVCTICPTINKIQAVFSSVACSTICRQLSNFSTVNPLYGRYVSGSIDGTFCLTLTTVDNVAGYCEWTATLSEPLIVHLFTNAHNTCSGTPDWVLSLDTIRVRVSGVGASKTLSIKITADDTVPPFGAGTNPFQWVLGFAYTASGHTCSIDGTYNSFAGEDCFGYDGSVQTVATDNATVTLTVNGC